MKRCFKQQNSSLALPTSTSEMAVIAYILEFLQAFARLRGNYEMWRWNRISRKKLPAGGANILYGANIDGANIDGANIDRANKDGANTDGANIYRWSQH